MNYELALQLKNAGFPQGGEGSRGGIIHAQGCDWKTVPCAQPYTPILDELIDACGKYICLVEDNERWCAHYSKTPFGTPIGLDAIDTFMVKREFGSTPTEAVAALYLALKNN